MECWYLAQIKPNSHRIAVRNLNRQGFKTFLPMYEVTRRKGLRFTTDVTPLFPGYIFVSIDGQSAPWRKINNTMGISRLVSFSGAPTPIPVELISSLMRRYDKEGKVLYQTPFSPGDSVEVLSGPFANFVATVEEIDAGQRISVLMDFMGQRARLHLKPDQVKVAQ